MLGDNFYDAGVNDENDPLWKLYYTDLYSAPSTQVPWYVVLGNHDYYTGTGHPEHTPQAEIDYFLKKKDNRWNAPSHFYTKTWTIPGSQDTFQIVFVDTVILAPNAASPAKTGLPTSAQVQDIMRAPYLAQVEAMLAASTAKFLIVAGHYHSMNDFLEKSYCLILYCVIVYTVTDGDGPTAELVDHLVPLMKKYKVSAYIHGHEHNAEVRFHIDLK